VKQLQAQVELMAKDIRKLSMAFNRFSRIPGQRFRGSGVPPVAVVPLAMTAPTTIGIDADVEGQINNEQAGENLLADLVLLWLQPITVVSARLQSHCLFYGRSLKSELQGERQPGYLQGLRGRREE